MIKEQKEQIESAADEYIKPIRHQLPLGGEQSVIDDFTAGATQVIKQPYLFGLGPRKSLGIQETRELVNQMLSEEISFSRFVELINEGGK